MLKGTFLSMTGNIRLIEIDEGLVRILAPDLEYYSSSSARIEPAWAPVFYNPRMRISRDLSVAIVSAFAKASGRSKIRVCEPLSATGVRGLRYAAEIEEIEEVLINDKSALAYELEVQNVTRNKLDNKVRVFNREARALLLEFAEKSEKFDVVDIDPFGSPAPFVESGLLALKHNGLLLVTATDLAPLFGVAPGSCKRKYFSTPMRTEFSKEVGARILAAFVVREAAKLGLAAEPIYAFLANHSLRIAFIVKRSKSLAKKFLDLLGGAIYCYKCFYRSLTSYSPPERSCPNCGSPLTIGGPLWTGDLWNPSFALNVLERYSERSYLSSAGLRIAKLIAVEAGKPALYSTSTSLAKLAGLGDEPSLERIAEIAGKLGVEFSPTHFDAKGFRIGIQLYELANYFRG
ncbi:MAG: hypothetical protein QXN94_02370 [Thermofilaceae archaeon]